MLSAVPSLLGNSKKVDFAKVAKEFDKVLTTITNMNDTNVPDNANYEPIRELLEKFYTMKLTNTNILLGKLFEKLKILMTKHSSTTEYNEVINQDSFYKNAINDFITIKTFDETFIKKIINSITPATGTATAIQATNENKNIYSNLYCSLLIIHYYPIVILNTIFSNAKANITSFKTTIPKLIDNYTTNIDTIISGVTSEADSATLAMNAANSAAASADDADADLVQAITHIEAAIARNEAIFTDPKKTDSNLTKAIKTAKDEKINARLTSNKSSEKSAAATTAAKKIEDAIKSKDPTSIKQAIADAQIHIKEATDSVQDTRKATKNLYTYLIKIEPHASKIRPLSSYFGGSNTSDDTMVGGAPGDIKNILTIINDVLDETDNTGSLIKYSTDIFYKALTILSISIGLPIDLNSNNIIVDQIKNLVNDEVIQKFTPPATTPATPATPAQEIATSINSIFNSSIDNNNNYPYFGEIIDDIFNNFYSADEKNLVEKLKRAQIEDTTKKNKLIEVQNNQNYAELAVNNAKKLAEKEHQIAKDAANKDLAIASNTKDSARSALGAFPSNIANDLERVYTDLARANITKTKAAAAAAAAVPPVPQAITQAFDDANAAVDAATAAAATVDADAAAAVTAAAAAAGTTFTSNDVTTFTNAITAFTNAKAKVDDADAATPATDATATNALSEAETATRTTREEAEKAAKGLESALAEVKAHANKKSKPITIENMKSTIDDEILRHFKEIFKPQDSISKKVVKGGQKTQKNRYRGGIRKNMNSIDSFDSIDSDL